MLVGQCDLESAHTIGFNGHVFVDRCDEHLIVLDRFTMLRLADVERADLVQTRDAAYRSS